MSDDLGPPGEGLGKVFIDWGTTNRRAFLVRNGRVESSVQDDRGVLRITDGAWREELKTLLHRLSADEPELVLLSGMAGSSRGWIETPYVECPVGPRESASGVHWLERRIGILSGVASPPGAPADVMRGEEPQVFGALALGHVPPSALICQPGTHNKWIRVVDGRIASFQTTMTGELFALLRTHSILASTAAPTVGPAFLEGLRRGLGSSALLAEIFRPRAEALLGLASLDDLPSLLSGVLIGADLRAGLADAPDGAIHIIGGPPLSGLYSAALRSTGRAANEVASSTAFVAGMEEITQLC